MESSNKRTSEKAMTRRLLLGSGLLSVGAGGLMLGGCDNKANQSARKTLPASFRYDISKLTEIDEKDMLYQEKSMVEAGLEGAKGMAISSDGKIVVGVGETVKWFDADGAATGEMKLEGDVHALAFDDDDRLIVGLPDGLVRLDDAGGIDHAWPKLGERAHVTGIAVNGDDVIVADAGNRQVVGYRGGDEMLRIEDFVLPSPYFDVSIDAEGLVWVAHTGRHRIEAYDMGGDLVRHWGRVGMSLPGFSGCCNPSHFAVMADGRFLTSEKGLHRVKIYDAAGELLGAVAGAEALGISKSSPAGRVRSGSQMGGPLVCVHPDGDMRIVSPLTGRFHTFTQKTA